MELVLVPDVITKQQKRTKIPFSSKSRTRKALPRIKNSAFAWQAGVLTAIKPPKVQVPQQHMTPQQAECKLQLKLMLAI